MEIPVIPSLEMPPPESADPMRARPPHWRWWHVLLMGFGVVLAQVLGAVAALIVVMLEHDIQTVQQALRLLQNADPIMLLSTPLVALVLLAVQEISMLAVMTLAMELRRINFSQVGFRRAQARWVLVGAGLAPGLIAARILVVVVIALLLGFSLEGSDAVSEVVTAGNTPLTIVAMLILVSVLVPLVEELFFRGVVYKWLRGFMRLWPAAILSGLIFGIYHWNPLQGLSAWILGIAAAWLYEKSGSLWPAVVLHIVTNFVAQGGAYLAQWAVTQ